MDKNVMDIKHVIFIAADMLLSNRYGIRSYLYTLHANFILIDTK